MHHCIRDEVNLFNLPETGF
uniref:Uncharacterized protein n=1 Tax=Anguilla anguilla TaxID=7936 RepID=A0A0E9PM03_ANGAN